MSFYRTLVAAVAAMSLSAVAFASDENTNNPADSSQAIQVADSSNAAGTKATTEEKVNINTGTAKEIMKVKVGGKAMGAAKAKAIVAYRKKNGNFTSFDDLKKVKGFKKMTDDNMKEIQDQMSM